MAVLAAVSTGCSRQLVIRQDPIINTAMMLERDFEKIDGRPLEVDVVMLYPKDFEDVNNSELLPSANLTADVWFELKGTSEIAVRGDQIIRFSDVKTAYGTRGRPLLNGSRVDRAEETKPLKIDFKGPINDKDSVIYVIPKFIGPNGGVLPVPAAMFHPPGAYSDTLQVHIGWDSSQSGR
jgi:hypothetical protein